MSACSDYSHYTVSDLTPEETSAAKAHLVGRRQRNKMSDDVKAKMEQAIQQILSTDPSTQHVGARAICSLTSSVYSTRKPFAQDPRVVPRLVDLLTQGNEGCSCYADLSLAFLAEVGGPVQLQIVNALGAATLKWLEDSDRKHLLAILLKNPTTETLTAAKRGKSRFIALFDVAVQTSDNVRCDAMINVLSSVIDISISCAGGMSHAEAEAVLCNHDGARQAALRSLAGSISNDIHAAAKTNGDYGTVTKRRLLVLKLAIAVQLDGDKRQQIVAEGGVAILVAELQRVVFRSDPNVEVQQRSSSEMIRQILPALAVVAMEMSVRKDIIGRGGLEALIALCSTSDDRGVELAVQLLEKLMVDDGIHVTISDTGGIPQRVRHLRYGLSDDLKRSTLMMLRSKYLVLESFSSSDAETTLRIFNDCNGPTELCHLCLGSVEQELRSTAGSLLQDLTGLIPTLLARFDVDSLCALDIMARALRSGAAIVDSRGIHLLAELAMRAQTDLQASAIRTLANLAYNSDANRALIAATGILPILVMLVLCGDVNHHATEAAVMALRNLAHDAVHRTMIGRTGVIPRMVGVVQTATSHRLREVATGLLGNLARQNHHTNQEIIARCDGIAALVGFARTAINARQRQTATMALWVLVKENNECREKFLAADGIQVISHVEQLNETNSQPWAERLLSSVRTRS